MEIEQPTTKEIFKVISFYERNIRNDGLPKNSCIRQVQLLCAKGVTLGSISRAMQNYAADPWVKSADVRLRLNIRRFMMAETIAKWQIPVVKDASLVGVHRMNQGAAEMIPVPIADLVTDDDSQGDL